MCFVKWVSKSIRNEAKLGQRTGREDKKDGEKIIVAGMQVADGV
jgi:hypothetical protein